MNRPHVQVFRSRASEQWYWRLVAGNGKRVAQSEGYTARSAAERGAYGMLRNALVAAEHTDVRVQDDP